MIKDSCKSSISSNCQRPLRALVIAGGLLSTPAPAPSQAITPAPTGAAARNIYTPADLARFGLRTAYDMLRQVPGFAIAAGEQERGLGQATENVLINGQRIANKQGGAVDQLHKIPVANVERIEVVNAASLGIAGLAGQVANVILRSAQEASGQFEWNPEFRAHYAKPNLFGGSVSYSGKRGPIDYSLSLKNEVGRGAYGGPIRIYDADGALTERRHELHQDNYDAVTLETRLGWDGPGTSVGHLTLGYTPYWNPEHQRDRRMLATGENRRRRTDTEREGWIYDISADFEFALGPGRLKLIGLHHFEHEPLVTTQVLEFDSGASPEGTRFGRDTRIAETIGRGEYNWNTDRNDWQISLERAFNSLDQKGRLFTLSPEGEFEEVPFPEGSGKVTEVRYEAIATLSRPIASNLDLQMAAGGEISRLALADSDLPLRKFFRPKGSLTVGWRPAVGWDASFKLRRRVGQISFDDFLAQPKLSEDRQNAGNPDLVPPQSWEVDVEVGRELGRWGKTRLRTYFHRVEDIIDNVPLANHNEGVGNLPRATRFGMESISSIELETVGWNSAKIEAQLGFERTRVRDPLTRKKRAISSTRDRWVRLDLRHDIPGSDYAWGASAVHDHSARAYLLTEISRSWEGPWWVGVFVEHKDVAGMTVRADVGNLVNARHRWTRFVYADWRDSAPIAFIQRNNQRIGPIFSLSVKGTF